MKARIFFYELKFVIFLIVFVKTMFLVDSYEVIMLVSCHIQRYNSI